MTVTAADAQILGAEVGNREGSGGNDQEGGVCDRNDRQRDDNDEERYPVQSDLMVVATEDSRATHNARDSDKDRVQGDGGNSVGGYDGGGSNNYAVGVDDSYAVGVNDSYAFGVNGSGSCSVPPAVNVETI